MRWLGPFPDLIRPRQRFLRENFHRLMNGGGSLLDPAIVGQFDKNIAGTFQRFLRDLGVFEHQLCAIEVEAVLKNSLEFGVGWIRVSGLALLKFDSAAAYACRNSNTHCVGVPSVRRSAEFFKEVLAKRAFAPALASRERDANRFNERRVNIERPALIEDPEFIYLMWKVLVASEDRADGALLFRDANGNFPVVRIDRGEVSCQFPAQHLARRDSWFRRKCSARAPKDYVTTFQTLPKTFAQSLLELRKVIGFAVYR